MPSKFFLTLFSYIMKNNCSRREWRELDTGITVELQILKMESTIKQIHIYMCM